jgi:hypothetical protein
MPKIDQTEALEALQRRLASRSEPPTRKEILDYNDPGSTEEQYLLRFLLEANLKVDTAEKNLVKDVLWRQQCDISAIQQVSEAEILGGVNPSDMFDAYASYQYGFDKQDRPVVYVHCARQDFSKVLKLVGFEGFMKFHAWKFEQIVRLNNRRSKSLGKRIDSFVYVFDIKGGSPLMITPSWCKLTPAYVSLESNHYPQR